MKIKFRAIVEVTKALKAVESDGYALQYVKDKKLFLSIAAAVGIDVEI